MGRIIVQEYAFKQFFSTCTKQKNPPREINREKLTRSKEYGAGVSPSRICELPQMIALWGFLIENPKIGLENEKNLQHHTKVNHLCNVVLDKVRTEIKTR